MVSEDFGELSAALVRLAAGDLRASFTSRRTPLGDGGGDEIAHVARSYDALVVGLGKTGVELAAGLAKLRGLIADVVAAANIKRTLAPRAVKRAKHDFVE